MLKKSNLLRSQYLPYPHLPFTGSAGAKSRLGMSCLHPSKWVSVWISKDQGSPLLIL